MAEIYPYFEGVFLLSQTGGEGKRAIFKLLA